MNASTAFALWSANAPLVMIDQYIGNLKRLRAIAFDAGAKDEPIAGAVRALDEVMSRYRLAHDFEIYEGTHIRRIAERIEAKTQPFFSKSLSFAQSPAGLTKPKR
jgi:S-formylglutathione hydrolase